MWFLLRNLHFSFSFFFLPPPKKKNISFLNLYFRSKAWDLNLEFCSTVYLYIDLFSLTWNVLGFFPFLILQTFVFLRLLLQWACYFFSFKCHTQNIYIYILVDKIQTAIISSDGVQHLRNCWCPDVWNLSVLL